MSNDADFYPDDPFFDPRDDQVPPHPDGPPAADEFFPSEPGFIDDDDFEVRSFDTGMFIPEYDEHSANEHLPSANDSHDINDDFAKMTFETQFVGNTPASPVIIPRQPQRSLAQSRVHQSRPPSQWLSTLRTMLIMLAAAVLVSTIFSLWTRPAFFTDTFRAELNQVQATQHVINIQPSPLPTDVREVRIGIIAGHSGTPLDPNFETDPGAVCPDGLTELRINEAVARETVAALQRDKYTVDLLTEFDPRLNGYQADVLISIHANDCQDYGEAGTGFNVASAAARQTTQGDDERLTLCLISQYGATTGKPHHQARTYDMTGYHTFSEVAVDTPTAIIEIGFMLNDRPLLLGQQPLVAQGIANSVRCFLRPEWYDIQVPSEQQGGN